MALSGAEISYISGQKNNWRRWMWNQIRQRIPKGKAARDCLVLYLAGAENADMEEAKRRGFRTENMIAVETEKGIAGHLRSQGVTTICGDVVDVLNCWPLDKPVDVVILDLCTGLHLDSARRIQCALLQPCFVGAALAINLQRGRDEISKFKGRFEAATKDPVSGLSLMKSSMTKHRGILFAADLGITATGIVAMAQMAGACKPGTLELTAKCAGELLKEMASNSYRHRVVRMDSVVAKIRFPPITNPARIDEMANKDMRRYIAAALAIRTMRRSGHLKSA